MLFCVQLVVAINQRARPSRIALGRTGCASDPLSSVNGGVITSVVHFLLELDPRRLITSCVLASLVGSIACQDPQSDGETSESSDSTEETPTESETGPDGPVIVCEPNDTRCADSGTVEVCAPTGLEWEATECEEFEECNPCFVQDEGNCVASCVGPCEQVAGQPSSEGCSFFATSMYQSLQPNEEFADAIIVGNPNPDLPATVELYFIPEGSNLEELEASVELMPGESHDFVLDASLTDYYEETSVYRSGKIHHVVSNIPIVAYLHSPYEASSTNGSSMLLPEQVMTGNYVVYSHAPFTPPSYFIVIALHNQTTVRWFPTVDTAGDGLPLDFVDSESPEGGEQLLNRYDNMRILSSALEVPPVCAHDLSGTVIEADKPIWVLSVNRGARIPFCHTEEVMGCPPVINPDCHAGSDLLQEQNIPLEFWGREYMGPHSPLRASEDHIWRIFAGEDNTTVNVDPPQPGTPIMLANRGDWQELVVPNGTNLYFSSDQVFMPVQYVTGHYEANNIGSPAMVQMVPTAQFLDNYVFVTGVAYETDYVQVMHEVGFADVYLDGEVVTGWTDVGTWEVATVQVSQGSHTITSEDNFGIVQYGWNSKPNASVTAGYAYPGGMKAEVIYVP